MDAESIACTPQFCKTGARHFEAFFPCRTDELEAVNKLNEGVTPKGPGQSAWLER